MHKRKIIPAVIILILVAVVPFSGNNYRTNPPIHTLHTLEANVRTPPEIAAMLHRSCYNCHSNETRWPLYSRLPVASSQMLSDVERARRVMNFSEWSIQAGRRPDLAASTLLAACAVLQTGEMPKFRYLVLHPGAWVTKAETDRFCAWSQATARELKPRSSE